VEWKLKWWEGRSLRRSAGGCGGESRASLQLQRNVSSLCNDDENKLGEDELRPEVKRVSESSSLAGRKISEVGGIALGWPSKYKDISPIRNQLAPYNHPHTTSLKLRHRSRRAMRSRPHA
jgi:hypothetical protein